MDRGKPAAHLLADMWEGLLHLLYPVLCAGCGREIAAHGPPVCLYCFEALPLTRFHLHAENPIEKIFRGRINISGAMAFVYFTKRSVVQRILHQLKYRGNRELGRYFGRRMGEALSESPFLHDVDALIPLPLFRARMKRRGYNQAALLCEGIAEVMQLPVLDKVVLRRNDTGTQTRRGRTERWEKMEGQFELGSIDAIAGKHILLVDDVITTGATLEACGAELLKIPNIKLAIATLAYTSL